MLDEKLHGCAEEKGAGAEEDNAPALLRHEAHELQPEHGQEQRRDIVAEAGRPDDSLREGPGGHAEQQQKRQHGAGEIAPDMQRMRQNEHDQREDRSLHKDAQRLTAHKEQHREVAEQTPVAVAERKGEHGGEGGGLRVRDRPEAHVVDLQRRSEADPGEQQKNRQRKRGGKSAFILKK